MNTQLGELLMRAANFEGMNDLEKEQWLKENAANAALATTYAASSDSLRSQFENSLD
jgi:hypothetical protein